ncbi:MAG: biliverdin-producing heme oxygenase [Synechococcaceae cyanobacterium]
MTSPTLAPISDHASPGDAEKRRGFGPRVRRLHARIGRAHHQAEGMTFSRSLLDGNATPRQLAALIRALTPAYGQLETLAPEAAARLGSSSIPWSDLARHAALKQDRDQLAALPATPPSAATGLWLERLSQLAATAPHRLMAHVYVRYGGDLSGGQQLAPFAAAILAAHGQPDLGFWRFPQPVADLRQHLHDGIEALTLSPGQEEELLEEAEAALRLTHRLLAELETLA